MRVDADTGYIYETAQCTLTLALVAVELLTIVSVRFSTYIIEGLISVSHTIASTRCIIERRHFEPQCIASQDRP